MKTTLIEIRNRFANSDKATRLIARLKANGFRSDENDDRKISVLDVLYFVSLDDALSVFDITEGYDKERMEFAVWCARQSEHLIKDWKVRHALVEVEAYLNGNIPSPYFHLSKKVLFKAALRQDYISAEKGAICAAYDAAMGRLSAAQLARYALRDAEATLEQRHAAYDECYFEQRKELGRILEAIEEKESA